MSTKALASLINHAIATATSRMQKNLFVDDLPTLTAIYAFIQSVLARLHKSSKNLVQINCCNASVDHLIAKLKVNNKFSLLVSPDYKT